MDFDCLKREYGDMMKTTYVVIDQDDEVENRETNAVDQVAELATHFPW